MMDRTEMTGLMERLVTTLYGSATVPPAEGGRFFHAICDERRREGDLFWTERRLNDLARELGYWPWSVSQVGNALRDARVAALPLVPWAELPQSASGIPDTD